MRVSEMVRLSKGAEVAIQEHRSIRLWSHAIERCMVRTLSNTTINTIQGTQSG